MKFFIGVVPPPDLQEKIFSFQKSFPSNKVPFYHEPHITLKAPSGLTEDKTWLPQVEEIVSNQPKFEIELDGLDQFDEQVLFLNPVFSPELANLHLKLVSLLNPDLVTQKKYFEGALYHPHLTLGETTWGELTQDEFILMRARAETEFNDIPPFQVSFVRIFQKHKDGEPYRRMLDINLKK